MTFISSAFARCGHGLADRAEAEDAERAAGQSAGLAVFFLLPRAVAKIDRGIDDPPVGGDQHADGQFGHGGGVLAGAIGHVNAARAGRGDIDGIDARSGADDQRKLRGPPGWSPP